MSSTINENSSYLRPITNDDLKLIFNWRNKPEIREYMFNNALIEWNTHLKWFDSLKSNTENDIKIFIEDSKPRGIVQFSKISKYHQTAEWGFYIGDSYRKGLGTLLAYHALNYIFNDLDIRKLSAQVLSTNEKSLRFHKKIGFIQEGVLRRQIIRDNKIIDVHLLAQFKQNWKNSERFIGGYIHG